MDKLRNILRCNIVLRQVMLRIIFFIAPQNSSLQVIMAPFNILLQRSTLGWLFTFAWLNSHPTKPIIQPNNYTLLLTCVCRVITHDYAAMDNIFLASLLVINFFTCLQISMMLLLNFKNKKPNKVPCKKTLK